MSVVNPTDQVASATAVANDGAPGPTTATDAAVSSPASSVATVDDISIDYSFVNVTGTGILGTSKIQYSTDGGSGWTDGASRSINGNASGTWNSGSLGNFDLAQIQVRAHVTIQQTIPPNSGSVLSDITAWSITYTELRERMLST